MAIEALIEKLKEQVGVERPPVVYAVEKGMVWRFAQAIGDPNPLWQNGEYAAKSRYSDIVAPPTFALILGFEQVVQALTLEPSVTVLHGSTDLETYLPIRPGDTITVTARIDNARERPGKMGSMLFITFDMRYRNQRQEAVARCRQMAIIY
jgi:acyl dehydratase